MEASACAQIRCADHVPPDDKNYKALKKLQDYGDTLGTNKFENLMAELGVDTTYEVKKSGRAKRSGKTRTVQGFEYNLGDTITDSTQAFVGDKIIAGHKYVTTGYKAGVFAIAEATAEISQNKTAKGFAEYAANDTYYDYIHATDDVIGLTTLNSFNAKTWKPGQDVVAELAEIGLDVAPIAKPFKAAGELGKVLLKDGVAVAKTTGRRVKSLLSSERKIAEEVDISTTKVKNGVPKSEAKFWNKPIESGGRRVYQRSDLFEATPENIERMNKGRPPIGYDGEPVNLHHLTQTEPGSIAEVGGKFHSDNTKTLHGLTEPKRSFRYSPDGKTTDAEKAFRRWSYRIWKDRAAGFTE